MAININNSQKKSEYKLFKSLYNSPKQNKRIKIKNFMSNNLRLKEYNIFKLKKSSSVESIIPKKIPSIKTFHNKIMSRNRLSYIQTLNEESLKFNSNNKTNMIFEQNNKDKNFNSENYELNDNIVSVKKTEIKKSKYNNEYKENEYDIKELLKKEIKNAEIKLNLKPEKLSNEKNHVNSLYMKKMEKYKYLSKINPIKEINQIGNTPIIVKDGKIMLKLIKDSFDYFKINI